MLVVAIYGITQMNYLNKALDTFNTAIVSPIYYVMFTTLTIFASVVMFKDWYDQDAGSIISQICGFVIVLSGTILLHATKYFVRSNYMPLSPSLSTRLSAGNVEIVDEDNESSSRRQELYT